MNPRKFVQAIRVIKCPDTFTPSAQGDFAYTTSYVYDGKKLAEGPAYSYDTMMSERIDPYERVVDVPRGTRVWIVTYDGQWGGFWSRVNVYVHPDEIPAPLRLPEPPLELEETVPERVPEEPVSERETTELKTPVDYDLRYTLDELRELCRGKGISTSGDKKTLARRLLAE